jgi:hypothetical protein
MKNIVLTLTAALFLSSALANDPAADQAWSRIEKLRGGPGEPPSGAPEEAVTLARRHLRIQEKALGDFLTQFPKDPRRFEAELEYTSVMTTLGASLSDRRRVESALQRMSALERSPTAPTRYRADAAFQRITTTMQTVNLAAAARPGETTGARNTILESAQNFAARYPEDRRAARLLAEAATLLDDQPSRKRKVLEQAALLARDEGTRQRIQDDLRRIDLVGKSPELKFTTVQGREFSLAAQRGRLVVLVFWASWSPPSMVWLANFITDTRELNTSRITFATVNLDKNLSHCRESMKKLGIEAWPTACSTAGWEDRAARQLTVNALPTVFIFDGQGRLRTLNARTDFASQIRQLLAEKP